MSVLADLCFCMRNKQLIYTRGSHEIFDSFLKLMFMCSQPFYPFKDLSILRIQKSYREIFTAEWRIEFYSTKVAVTRDYYLFIF